MFSLPMTYSPTCWSGGVGSTTWRSWAFCGGILFKKRKKYAYQQQYRKTEYADRGETLKDPYTILEVDRNATAEEIKKAYRRLVNKYHPDKVVHLGEEFKKLAEKHFKEVQEAYQKIKDRL